VPRAREGYHAITIDLPPFGYSEQPAMTLDAALDIDPPTGAPAPAGVVPALLHPAATARDLVSRSAGSRERPSEHSTRCHE
jgi:hypothetical protein